MRHLFSLHSLEVEIDTMISSSHFRRQMTHITRMKPSGQAVYVYAGKHYGCTRFHLASTWHISCAVWRKAKMNKHFMSNLCINRWENDGVFFDFIEFHCCCCCCFFVETLVFFKSWHQSFVRRILTNYPTAKWSPRLYNSFHRWEIGVIKLR